MKSELFENFNFRKVIKNFLFRWSNVIVYCEGNSTGRLRNYKALFKKEGHLEFLEIQGYDHGEVTDNYCFDYCNLNFLCTSREIFFVSLFLIFRFLCFFLNH